MAQGPDRMVGFLVSGEPAIQFEKRLAGDRMVGFLALGNAD